MILVGTRLDFMLPQFVGRVRFSRTALGGAVPEGNPDNALRENLDLSSRRSIWFVNRYSQIGCDLSTPMYAPPQTVPQDVVCHGPRLRRLELLLGFFKDL
jgi:hypothetical protein